MNSLRKIKAKYPTSQDTRHLPLSRLVNIGLNFTKKTIFHG